MKPEELAREDIDEALRLAGWEVQDRAQVNVDAARGVAVREFPHYLLSEGLPEGLPAPLRPLPFLYQSTGVETRFTNRLDVEARSRSLFHFHRPETLAEWLEAEPLLLPATGGKPASQSLQPSTLRTRPRAMPSLEDEKLWRVQRTAVRNLERSHAEDRPRALIQMATGSGKTFTAVTAPYRLLKHTKARRVLFLVDRANLGQQALKEFQQYVTPDDGSPTPILLPPLLVQRRIVDEVDRRISVINGLEAQLEANLT